MAYSDLQEKVNQVRMNNSVLLAEKYSQGNLFPKGSDENPYSKNPRAEGARKKRQFKKDQEAKKKAKEVSDNARQREWNARKERGEVFGDMPPDFNLMENLDPNTLLQIGGAVGGGLLKLLIDPMNLQMSKLPHTPPTEKIVLPNGKLMDSPLRFKTDQERIKFMEDFSRGYGRYS